jgi:WS/DGAT/MGAT family acyltransferase
VKQLSSMDAQFLMVETPTTTGHVGALVLLDPSTAPGGELTLEDFRDMVEARLHLAAPLRERVVEVPLGLGSPFWAEDPHFDLEFHVREVALPAPGDDAQLAEQVARIHARPLDRSRPLWEMYVIHGVDGDGAAVYVKFHHAAIDGISGAEILATILDEDAVPRDVEAPERPWDPPALPDPVSLLVAGVASTALRSGRLLTQLPTRLPYLADLPGARNSPTARLVSDLAGSLLSAVTGTPASPPDSRLLAVPPTPFNGPITAHRRFAYGSVDLAAVKRVKDAFGLTVNDVVMAMSTTALRRWLLDHDALPDIPLVAAVPVSVRSEGDTSIEGNLLSVMLTTLPTDLREPLERLHAVAAAMSDAKEVFDGVPASILQDFSAVIPTAFSGWAARSLFRMASGASRAFNLPISNVPGPQAQLYVAGARVTGMHPMSAVSDLTGGMNITLLSQNGSLDFGIVVCREMVPDVWRVAGTSATPSTSWWPSSTTDGGRPR